MFTLYMTVITSTKHCDMIDLFHSWLSDVMLYLHPHMYTGIVQLPGIGDSLTIPTEPRWIAHEPMSSTPHRALSQLHTKHTKHTETVPHTYTRDGSQWSVLDIFGDCIGMPRYHGQGLEGI